MAVPIGMTILLKRLPMAQAECIVNAQQSINYKPWMTELGQLDFGTLDSSHSKSEACTLSRVPSEEKNQPFRGEFEGS
jgi:hypothetical protein